MLHDLFKLMICIFVATLLANEADAQTIGWSTQGASGCSDQYGSFDAFIPGMRGHGSCNRGGFVPGTTVFVVDNLSELQTAAGAACPKVILFGFSGLINLGGQSLSMNRCNNWSMIGASAPGQTTITGSVDTTIEVRGSNWTVDHLTIAPGDTSITGGNTGNRRAIQYSFGVGLSDDSGILLNNNLIWGPDETVTCYTKIGSEQTNMLAWQNVIALPTGQRLLHIIQDTCPNYATIRNVYIHSDGRMPLVRADGYLHANNFAANPGFQTSLVQPCSGAGALATTRMNFINNFTVRGPDSGGQPHLLGQNASCTNLEVHESGNATMNNDNTIEDCTNNKCTGGFVGDDLKANQISAIMPQGYVPEPITQTTQGLSDFATRITGYAGARPVSRLPYIQSNIDEAINMVDGSGPEGSHSVDASSEGGIAVVTPSFSTNYDPTNASDNPCGENMPTGATANAIQSSGLTRLHEWVIGCFYDNVMPAAYREDSLQNYGAPGGGGLGAPPPPPPPPPPPERTPNPPGGFGAA